MRAKTGAEQTGYLVELAWEQGLDGYPVVIRNCSTETLYGLAAAGFPGRFTHWSFGKAAETLLAGHAHKRHRLYELVVYADPCWAFIAEECTPGEQVLLTAHVLAHSDLFKNNVCFQAIPPQPPDFFARHGEEIGEYEATYGYQTVESFLDAVLSVKELFQPPGSSTKNRDLLGLLQQSSPVLAPWQRRILGLIEEETRQLWPQRETRMLSEGWASFWHQRLLELCNLTEEETVDAARLHARLMAPVGPVVNVYLVGNAILQRVFREEGMASLFRLRAVHNDYSFIQSYLTEGLLQELNINLYCPQQDTWISGREDWQTVKKVWLNYLENGGYPVIFIEDTNYRSRGQLYLRHDYRGLELDRAKARKTLAYVEQLWGKAVLLETVCDGQRCILQSNYY